MKTLKMKFILIILLFATASNLCSGINQKDKYLAFAEVMPNPVGGISAIVRTIVYPEIAKRNRIEGKVYVQAYVDENGVAEEVKLVKGIGAGCDDAALEAVKKAKYTSGKVKGKAVKVKLTMAITFKLN